MPDEFDERSPTILDLVVDDLTPVEEPVCERCGGAAFECGEEIDPTRPLKCCFTPRRRYIWCRNDPLGAAGGYTFFPDGPRR